jgi:MOSC domain-containing protein YiiM
MPCYKLGLRFGDMAMVKTFVQFGRPGIYFAVKDEGVVGPGDPIERVHVDENRVSVIDMFRLILDRRPSPDALRKVLAVPALAQVWREEFEARLAR